jgi:hypothetical protein
MSGKPRTARARLSEQNIQDRKPRKGNPHQESWDRTDKTGQAEYNRKNTTERIGELRRRVMRQDSQNR